MVKIVEEDVKVTFIDGTLLHHADGQGFKFWYSHMWPEQSCTYMHKIRSLRETENAGLFSLWLTAGWFLHTVRKRCDWTGKYLQLSRTARPLPSPWGFGCVANHWSSVHDCLQVSFRRRSVILLIVLYQFGSFCPLAMIISPPQIYQPRQEAVLWCHAR